jgi:type II secretion system protein J
MKRDRGGFTLVEMLVAVAIVAFMTVMIYGVVAAAIRSHQAMEEILEGTEAPPALLNVIRQDIESAFVPDGQPSYFLGVDKAGAFGPADELDFVSSATVYGRAGENEEAAFHPINEVGYRLMPNPNDRDYWVLYRRQDYFVDDAPTKGGTLVELYDRVRTFSVEYWDGRTWIPSWDSSRAQGKLPAAVRVEIGMVSGPPESAPPIVTHAIVIPLVQ